MLYDITTPFSREAGWCAFVCDAHVRMRDDAPELFGIAISFVYLVECRPTRSLLKTN